MIKLRSALLIMALMVLTGFLSILTGQENMLPHQMTAEERVIMADYLREHHENALRSVPIPPPAAVRTMAEWEELQALMISWRGQTTILTEIVRHVVKECKILILTTNPASVTTTLENAGIPLDSVEFVNTPTNTIWIRDFGPWAVYQNDVDSLMLVDWIYNRPRVNDDLSPNSVATHLNVPIYEATVAPYDWIHTGGNHLPDGMGTVFSSDLVLDENPGKTEDQIDSIANIFLGVNKYVKLPKLPYDGIHHLDMHMRIIDEETIMFGEYPEGVSDGPQIEANIKYIQDSLVTPFGNPYTIIRLPMPPDGNDRYPSQGGHYRTYTNSVFVNKTILVPTYEERYDTTALRIYRESLPGYNVVGINCNSIIPSLGAIHCITKAVGTENPLLINHARLRDSHDETQEYPVVATIKHRDGIEIAYLFYKLKADTNYTQVPMVLVDSVNSHWAGIIPPHSAGEEINYFILGMAKNGKAQVRPITAPAGYFKFSVIGETANQPPVVQITHPLNESVFDITEPFISIDFEATDADGEIDSAFIYINSALVSTLDTLPYTMEWSGYTEGSYEIVVEVMDDAGAVASSDTVKVYIESTTATNPISPLDQIKVFPNPVGGQLWVDWSALPSSVSSVTLLNNLGQIQSIPQSQETGKATLDCSSLPAGIYYLDIRYQEESQLIRVVKN